MHRAAIHLFCFWILAGSAGLLGCTGREPYRYDAIRAQYADPACHSASVKAAGTAPEACSLGDDLTLGRVLSIARANNPDLLMAAARIERARALLKKSAAPFYPQIHLYSEYMQGDAPSAYLFKIIDQRKLPAGTNFNDPGWFENYESGIKAGVNLFNGGRDRLHREMANAGLAISQFDRNGVENRILATAIGAYYDVLAAGNFIDVAEESVENTRSQLRIMEVRYRAGSALKTDLLSLRVRMAETEEVLVQSRNRQSLAKAALAEILGVEPEAAFGITETREKALAIPDDSAAALDYALAHRPELAAVREKLRQAKMGLDATRAGHLPQVDLMTRYYADDPRLKYNADRDNWTAGLFLNWNIFDGFATRSDRAEALSRLQEIMAADRKTLLAVKFDVKKAYLNYNEAQERMKVAASNVQTARETYELVKRQYEGGSANVTRYLEAELAYNRARLHETTAYFDREKAVAQIARAIGSWTGDQPVETR